MLTIWYPGWCAYPLNSSYPICSRGGSGSRKDGRQKERDNWRQNKVQTQIRLRGRGELGWKHSEEQSEINLDTPDGLKLVSAHVCVLLSSCQLVHLGLCVGIYLCVFSVSSEIQQHLVCTQWAGSDISLMEKDKNTQEQPHKHFANIWLTGLWPSEQGMEYVHVCVCVKDCILSNVQLNTWPLLSDSYYWLSCVSHRHTLSTTHLHVPCIFFKSKQGLD